MFIGRLLPPKLTPHFNTIGFISLTKMCLSSGRKYERLRHFEASTNKDIGQNGMHWHAFKGLLTNIKQKTMGNVLMMDKTKGEDSVSPESPMVSSSDVTADKVLNLQNVAESKNCITSTTKEESSISEMGYQDVPQSVVGVEPSGKEESKSVNNERLSGLDFEQEELLRLIPAERVDPPDKSNNVSLCSLTEEVSESLALSGENMRNFLPERKQSDQAKPPQKRLSNLFINSNPCEEVKFPLRVEASQSVVGVEPSGKRESISINIERLDDNSNNLDGLDFGREKLLRLIPAEIVDSPEEPSSNNGSMWSFLTEDEVSESPASSAENLGKLLPEKRQPDQAKPPQNSLSNLFISSTQDKEVKFPLRVEALSNSNSNLSTGQSCSDVGDLHGLLGKMLSDPIQKIKSISNENDEHRLLDAPQISIASVPLKSGSHDQKSGDLTAIRERERTFSSESSSKTVVPVAVSSEFSMKKVMDYFNLPTDSGTDADANLSNLNDGEGKYVSKDNSMMKTSDRLCVTEEGESKEEIIVMQDQSLYSPAVLATDNMNSKVTEKSLFKLSDGEYSPNRVLLRFCKETFEKKHIVGAFSKFGAVLDVQEIPSYKGCIYKDALVTFETNSAMKMALERAVVMVKNQGVVVEATSQEDMVEKISIPDLIGDPDVPVALVKEPTRTVKIHPLEHGVSSNQIKEALKFCKNDISKIISGSSKTAAFVEFKTEDGKERALAEHSISILEKQSFIYRIDIPRTTVVRINLSELRATHKLIEKLCTPCGQIKQVNIRGENTVDVHFNVSEWPNMLTILNSLNGKKIDGMKLVVRPATNVIPPEILKALWEDPREKGYVKSVVENLVREINQPLDLTRCHTFQRYITIASM